VVVIGSDFFNHADADFSELQVEITRLLAVGGTVVVGEPPAPVPEAQGNWSALFRRSPLLESTTFRNVFRRANPLTNGVRFCPDCGLCSPFDPKPKGHCARRLGQASAKGSGVCQPRVQPDYVSLDDPRRKKAILREKSFSKGRLHHWPVVNVLKTQTREMWTDRCLRKTRSWFYSNYVGNDEPDGSRGRVHKAEWHRNEFSAWVSAGRVKSVLDAGAGSCTLDYVLRHEGLTRKLKPYVPFGFYDCSQARICAERGTLTLAWNWLNPLPFCKDCTFDLVFQAEGMHHIGQGCANNSLACVEPLWKQTFDNFDAHVACGGHIYVTDHRCKEHEEFYTGAGRSLCWRHGGRSWAKAKKYSITEPNNGLLIKKIC
jgi:hypothetical protein